MKKFLKWAAIIVIGLVVLGALLPNDKAASTSGAAADTSDAAAPVEAAAPAMKVTARELFKAYDANEIAADGQYKGKRIEISGTIESIASDMFDEPLVQLSAGEFNTVGAQGIPKDVAAKLSKGQEISLACTGAGEVVGMPSLSDCSLR